MSRPLAEMKFPHFCLPVGKIEAAVGAAKRAIRSRYIAVGRGYSQPRAGGHHDHQAGLAAILRGRRAFDDFHRLHGVDRELIREDLALLVRNRLAVDGERVRGVIAESVEKTVGVGRNSRRGQRHQRTERRGVAFERQLVEKLPIHVRVGGGIGFDQIAAVLSRLRFRSPRRSSGRTLLQQATRERTSTSCSASLKSRRRWR